MIKKKYNLARPLRSGLAGRSEGRRPVEVVVCTDREAL